MKNDGGPAFPRQTFEYYPSLNKTHAGNCDPGMSLRDYFVAHAPPAEIAYLVPSDLKGCAAYIGISAEEYTGNQHYCMVLAKARAEWADAMLKEREK